MRTRRPARRKVDRRRSGPGGIRHWPAQETSGALRSGGFGASAGRRAQSVVALKSREPPPCQDLRATGGRGQLPEQGKPSRKEPLVQGPTAASSPAAPMRQLSVLPKEDRAAGPLKLVPAQRPAHSPATYSPISPKPLSTSWASAS